MLCFPARGKMICAIVCLLQLIKGENVSGMWKHGTLYYVVSNVLMDFEEGKKHHYYTSVNKISSNAVSAFHLQGVHIR